MSQIPSTSSGWLGRRGILFAGGVLAVAGLLSFVLRDRADSPYFSDPLTGPTSPRLLIPAGKYGHTPQGLRRIQSDNGVDRPMVKTVSAAYLQTSRFTAEVSVTMADDDIAFFGLGQAATDFSYSNEPAHCFVFRVHNIGYSRIKIAAVQLGGASHYLDDRDLGAYVPGTTETFRIGREGDYVTLSIPRRNVSRTYSISQYNAQLGLTAGNTCLFFGSTGIGTVFSNFRVARISAVDDATPSGPR